MAPSLHIYRWKPACVLRAAGPDAFAFLQGQFSNDLRDSGGGEPIYGLWLNRKGHVVADGFVKQRGEGDLLIFSYFSPAAVVLGQLESNLIADEVTLEDQTVQWEGMTAPQGSVPTGDGRIRFKGRRGIPGYEDLLSPVGAAPSPAPPADGAALERARIEAGIPAVPGDIGLRELPNEGGLESAAVSYVKGCYLGQEVMARLKSMGQVRRQLLRIHGSGVAPVPGIRLHQGERAVGEMRTSAPVGEGFIGFALLSLMHLDRGAPLAAVPGGPAVARLDL